MQGAPRAHWRSWLRTTAFGVMAAVSLLAVALGKLAPLEERGQAVQAELYGRGGDTFMGLYYLGHSYGWEEEPPGSLQRRALDYFRYQARDCYLLSLQADPSEVRTQASLALVLDALGRQTEARRAISDLLKRDLSRSLRRELTAVFAIIVSTRARHKVVDTAYGFLAGLAPGRMTLARAYESMGEEALAQEEWAQAEAESEPLLRSVVVMVAVCGAMVLAGVLGMLWLIALRLRRRGAEPEVRESPGGATWTTREALEALILWIFSGLVFALLAAMAAPSQMEIGLMGLIFASTLGGIVAIAWVWLAAGRQTVFGWRLPGQGWSGAWRRVASGIAAAGLCAIPLLWIYKLFQELMGEGLGDDPIVPLVVACQGWEGRALLLVALCGVVPALEETLFRSVLFGALRRQWSFLPAAAVSAAVFAVAHLQFAALAGHFLLGLLFAYLYERSSSLLTPWAAHGAFNAFNLAILLTLFG